MYASVNHHAARSQARRKPAGELADWLLEAALVMCVFSTAAIAVAYFVLLIVV